MYKHDPMQFSRSEYKIYPAVYKPAKKDKYLVILLVALFLFASLLSI